MKTWVYQLKDLMRPRGIQTIDFVSYTIAFTGVPTFDDDLRGLGCQVKCKVFETSAGCGQNTPVVCQQLPVFCLAERNSKYEI